MSGMIIGELAAVAAHEVRCFNIIEVREEHEVIAVIDPENGHYNQCMCRCSSLEEAQGYLKEYCKQYDKIAYYHPNHIVVGTNGSRFQV